MPEIVCPQCEHVCEESHKFCPVCGFPISELSKDTDDQLIGTTLPGGYVILELVGVGGMGRVYRAEQKALGRTVAVKIIHPHLLGDESASVRFITEARAASRLNHPNSVGVIDFGKNGGQLYLVMEFLRGRDLARVMYDDGFLPYRRIVDVLCQCLAALAEAHHLGIIHRDLKPENIVLEPMRSGGDFVKVVDFGLAKMRAEVNTNITSPGIVCGTPDYMAPEQGRGDPIDARSDLYACGVILFQLLTGRLPFEAESPTQVVLMHLSIPPPNPSKIAPDREIPEALVEVCLKSLEKDPAKRYQSADEFSNALKSALSSFDVPSGRHTFEPPSGRFAWPDTIPCGSCGAMVPRGQKFCGECGARVVMPEVVKQPSAAPPPDRQGRRENRRERLSSIPRLPLPFTARDEDLEWLEACRLEVGSSVTAVRLVGENGVGKTRLLGEFLLRAADAGDIIVEAGPDPWWSEVGHYALREAIIGLAQLPPGGGEPSDWSSASPEARKGLMEVFGKGPRTRDSNKAPSWATPATSADGLSPSDRRFVAAEALRWAMGQAHHKAGKNRVILAIDDLHAVDGASRNAFADVIAEPPLASMLLIATHVPGFSSRWGGSQREIPGLPTAVAAALAKGTTDGQSVPPRGSKPGEGSTIPPLYVDQLVRFTMEGGSEPPARLGDLITLRIERLAPDARRALQAVAVLGDATDPAQLPRLFASAGDESRPRTSSADRSAVSAGLDDVLATLSIAGLITQSAAGNGRVRISHPLVRDVVLATIPAGVRRELHSRAADDTEGEPLPVEVRGLHAYHAQSAFEALMLLETVASRAAARGDSAGTVLALRRGLDLARREIFRGELDDPMRAVLIFSRKLGDALALAGDLTDADGVLREALDLAGPGGSDRAYVLGSLAYVSHERRRANEANGFLREAIEIAKLSSRTDLVSSLERMRSQWAAGAAGDA